MKKKKTIIYLHRYPIEYESLIYPSTRKIIDLLLKKYNVVWISFKPTSKIDENLRKGIKCIELPYAVDRKSSKDKWLKMMLWYLNIGKIIKIIKENNASFIIHKEQLPFIPSILRRIKIPILLDIGDWWLTTLLCKYNLEFISEKIENLEIRDWNKYDNLFVTTHSNAEAEMISKRGMDRKRIFVINHPSSNETYKKIDSKDLRNKLGLKNKFVFAVHGIIHPSKDYGLLLKWWKEISSSHKDWVLLIIGGTIGEKWCRNKIRELKIENSTIMTGWLKDTKELNRYLNVADSLLVTRKNNLANEGLIPSSLFHSFSIGKPIIITGLSGLKEMIEDKKSGYSYIPDDYNSFKKTLEYVYNNPKEAKKVGEEGIKRGEKMFDPKKSADGFYQVVDKFINKSGI